MSRWHKYIWSVLLLTGLGAGIACGQESNPERELKTTMTLTSRAFRVAAERIKPQLVTIESFGGVSAVQGRIGGIRKQGEGNTTGLLISKDGHIVTSTFNFIQSPPVITVITGDGKRRVAKLLGRDAIRKLCILKIEPYEDIELPAFADVRKIEVGQWAISIGVGYGDANPAISSGIISATNRIGGRAIQTDANISPANYGGPLVDIHGKVIGICVPLHPQQPAIGAGVEWYDSGIGFAIPLTAEDDFVASLKRGENIYPAFLGVRTKPNLEGSGLRVTEVVTESPASQAGLKNDDVILTIGGIPVDDLQGLRRVLYRHEAGESIPLQFRRSDEKAQTVTVLLGRVPPPQGAPPPLQPPDIR